jgi:hypothetical protein
MVAGFILRTKVGKKKMRFKIYHCKLFKSIGSVVNGGGLFMRLNCFIFI